jgi:hypothetical protein
MKKLFVLTVALVAAAATSASAVSAHGSAFGNFATATTLGQGKGAFGVGVGIADATSVVGWFNYGLSTYIDGRLKLGLIDNSETEVTFGADFKYQFWSATGTVPNPLDMAVGGFFEFVDYGPLSVLQVGGDLKGSYPFTLSNNTVLSPYGRFQIRLENASWDAEWVGPGLGSDSESELEFGVNGGVSWQLTRNITAYGEFQIDGNDGVFLGIDFGVL